jgi:hypothetical protein
VDRDALDAHVGETKAAKEARVAAEAAYGAWPTSPRRAAVPAPAPAALLCSAAHVRGFLDLA